MPKKNGHVLYTAKDFTEAELSRGNIIAVTVIEKGLDVCKQCGAYESGLNRPCSAAFMFILAGSISSARDYARARRLSSRNWTYLDDVEKLRGQRGAVVVRLPCWSASITPLIADEIHLLTLHEMPVVDDDISNYAGA